eukprot:scpid11680/ scgid30154/ 
MEMHGSLKPRGRDGYRLQCSIVIPANLTNHTADATHHCGKVHRCGTTCPMCSCYCDKEIGHDGLHSIEDHGKVVNIAAVLKKETRDLVRHGSDLTCKQLCISAGRGHIHLMTTRDSAVQGKNAGEVDHRRFWSHFNFEDPCSSDTDREIFGRCSAYCHDCLPADCEDSSSGIQHDDHSAGLNYCTEAVLHGRLTGPTNNSGGYTSIERDYQQSGTLPGHHFLCRKQHTCHGRCECIDDNEQCSERCQKEISHDGTCSCGKFHRCGDTCSVKKTSRDITIRCTKQCNESSEKIDHICYCDDTKCHAVCNIQECRNQCNLDHQHEGNLHDCEQEHTCAAPCQDDGRCEQQLQPVEEVDGQSVPLAENAGQADIWQKLTCNIPLKRGVRSHTGSHSCKGIHLCMDACKHCAAPCFLEVKHTTLVHEANHRPFTSGRRLQIFYGDRRQVRTSQQTTCATACKTAGAGHFHVLGKCENKAHCTVDPGQIRHYQWQGQCLHIASHATFWQSISYKDPYSDKEDSFFQSCHVQCTKGHGEEDRPHCAGEMWHASYRMQRTGYVMGVLDQLSLQQTPPVFHFFENDQHKCTQRCKIRNAGNLCNRGCQKQIQHNCSPRCEADCPGTGDPKHFAGVPQHHCFEEHDCREFCDSSHPGVCFLASADNPAPIGSRRIRQNSNAYKVKCSVAYPVGQSDHGKRQESHSCGREHTCEKFCPLCERYCRMPYAHKEPCETDHSFVINTKKAVITMQDGSKLTITGHQQTCSEICNAAGPSHSHHVPCTCTGMIYFQPQPFHKHKEQPLRGGRYDLTTHCVFWEENRFQDPCRD